MKLDLLVDFADAATSEIGRFKFPFVLSPDRMKGGGYPVPSLTWDSVSYGDEEVNQVPNDRRGVYAFAVCHNDDVLPPHGYVLYIGMAGRNSKRSLRERYMDYLNERKVRKRDRIAFMIGTWHPVLRFFFAPVGDEVSNDDLQTLERQLNSALMPPFSEGDLEADIRQKRRAFRL